MLEWQKTLSFENGLCDKAHELRLRNEFALRYSMKLNYIQI